MVRLLRLNPKGQDADLFTAVDATPLQSISADALTLHSRVVRLDLAQLQRAQAMGTTVHVNLFDDTVVTGIIERTSSTFSGGYALTGRIVENSALAKGSLRCVPCPYGVSPLPPALNIQPHHCDAVLSNAGYWLTRLWIVWVIMPPFDLA